MREVFGLSVLTLVICRRCSGKQNTYSSRSSRRVQSYSVVGDMALGCRKEKTVPPTEAEERVLAAVQEVKSGKSTRPDAKTVCKTTAQYSILT